MKAVIYKEYGAPEVLQITEKEKPAPGENEILIKVHASTVNAADINTRGFVYVPPGLKFLARLMMGLRRPRIEILGSGIAGTVEAVGKDVSAFKIGDQVFGSSNEMGGYAEYTCRSAEGVLALKPDNISHEEAASITYGGLTALYFLRDKGMIKRGQKVLINGASGGVGVFAVQLARYFGAEVSGVCSAANAELVNSLGAHKVIDYAKEDFTKSGEKWDLICDIVVGKTSFSRCKGSLNPKGLYLAVAGGLNDMLQMVWTSIIGGRKVIVGGGSACEKIENLVFLAELIQAGKLKVIIDKSFPLDEVVDAHSYVESGSKKGNVAISMV